MLGAERRICALIIKINVFSEWFNSILPGWQYSRATAEQCPCHKSDRALKKPISNTGNHLRSEFLPRSKPYCFSRQSLRHQDIAGSDKPYNGGGVIYIYIHTKDSSKPLTILSPLAMMDLESGLLEPRSAPRFLPGWRASRDDRYKSSLTERFEKCSVQTEPETKNRIANNFLTQQRSSFM